MNEYTSLRLRYLALAAAALTITACGGGGSDDPAPAPAPSPSPAPAPTAAATCSQLTNGLYRALGLLDEQKDAFEKVTIAIDANGVPQMTSPDGSVEPMQPGKEACTFTIGSAQVAVGNGGIMLISVSEDVGGRSPAIAFPDQPAVITADLTGTWNRIDWNRDGGNAFKLLYGTITVAAGGIITAGKECTTTTPIQCNTDWTVPANSALVADAAGGFKGTGGAQGSRAFLFKNGNDSLLISRDEGGIMLATKQAAWNLPTVGTVTNGWVTQSDSAGKLLVANDDAIPGLYTSTNTIKSVDAATGTIVRDNSKNGATAVSQSLTYNTPLPGMVVRQGVSGSVSPAVFLRLTSDLTVASRLNATAATTPGTGNGFFALALAKP